MNKNIIILGASGAVGSQALATLQNIAGIDKISLLNRREMKGLGNKVIEHVVDVLDAKTYKTFIPNHETAICTLGIGEPSKVSKEEFIKIDKTAVIEFAKACKTGEVKHFHLLASVGISPKSRSLYLRTKGELVEALKALNFERLSIFKPSMILTPNNRYGWTQGLTLAVWPKLHWMMQGSAKKYRGIRVETLGAAIAANTVTTGTGYEELCYEDFIELSDQ
jgi:uncharacterized protein YbjT (DUF2867 family)